MKFKMLTIYWDDRLEEGVISVHDSFYDTYDTMRMDLLMDAEGLIAELMASEREKMWKDWPKEVKA